jgi:hypothetical protein
MQADRCEQARSNAISAIRPGSRFPDNVFAGAWSNFLFFESDALIVGNFVWAIKEFLRIERATSASLINLTRYGRGSSRHSLCLNADITNDRYQEELRVEDDDAGWIYLMEDYVCASNLGSWCIYAERSNDVAVIALRNVAASSQFHFALGYLGADSLTYQMRTSFPFTHFIADWRAGLLKNYRPSRGRNPV